MILDRLFETIAGRKTADPTTSYTAKLFSRGRARIAQKVGEEAVETVIAAASNDTAHIVTESADLLYHLLVLWADADIRPEQVWQTLESREGISGIAEKNSRTKE
ncbi:MAG TPA: phosphoribosyl-ATP diphosphatase [Alphaproteobacteria bacterium]|nr:phosphoribosyl-ATP diphosphatase [Alphaproteobacteria bacterium]